MVSSMSKDIRVQGAKTHNLKNVDVTIPRDSLTVMTGLSGSGKSSLAFDTLYAEGQRRYVESLSSYARQFLSMMEKPEVDHIEGLSPAISIEQKTASHNPRSTVGTITEIYDYLRLLFARVGIPHCPKHNLALQSQTVSQMVDAVLKLPEGARIMIMAPVVSNRKGEHTGILDKLRAQGYVRVRIDGQIMELDTEIELNAKQKHTIDVIVDRLKLREDIQIRLAESIETALRLSDGLLGISMIDGDAPDRVFSAKYACIECGYSLPELEPRLFSFNNPIGACSSCDGLGHTQTFDPELVVVNDELSLAGGAIPSWGRTNTFHYCWLEALAEHYHFDLEMPYRDLSDSVKKLVLYGSGSVKLDVKAVGPRVRRFRKQRAFEGILANMSRRYQDTESTAVREELAKYLSHGSCSTCEGSRLCETARHVTVGQHHLPELVNRSINDLHKRLSDLNLTGNAAEIADRILNEILARLHFLLSVGLNYLSLNRTADTLSGGEAQRIRLASQIGSGLVGVMYILDEPSIGLHQRDNQRLLDTLRTLKSLGNTVIVVEHDEDAIRAADHVIDIGPGAGRHGGHIVSSGTPEHIKNDPASLTGQYLSGKLCIEVPKDRAPYDPKRVMRLFGASLNNLHDVDASFPIGLLTCVTGVSGSGKSSLINDTLLQVAAQKLNRATSSKPGPYKSITGLDMLDKVVAIDQSPIGRTPRSNPATYTGLFTPIRDLFTATPEARMRGYAPGRFSFNVPGGRCSACDGDGLIRVEMHFLADIHVTCDVCKGQRYNRETLEVHYKGKNIGDVLGMTIEEALEFFSAVPVLANKLQTLIDVGLGYIQLGQSATTLSGGEAQRIKLSKELSKRSTGNTLYVLDEPTTGLHFHDVKQLLNVLHRLRASGNTVIVIEHNLDVIKTADWVIDIGPEGGNGGGQILCYGAPEEIAAHKGSHTGKYLKPLLKKA